MVGERVSVTVPSRRWYPWHGVPRPGTSVFRIERGAGTRKVDVVFIAEDKFVNRVGVAFIEKELRRKLGGTG